MLREAFLMEKTGAKILGFKDANDSGIVGTRVDMQKFERVTFLALAVAGTTTTAHTFTLKQHSVATAGTPADLAVKNPYFHKVDSATKFTKVVPAAAAASYDLHSLVGDAAYLVAFEVLAEDLTGANRWVSIDLGDTGTAQVTAILAIGHQSKQTPVFGLDL